MIFHSIFYFSIFQNHLEYVTSNYKEKLSKFSQENPLSIVSRSFPHLSQSAFSSLGNLKLAIIPFFWYTSCFFEDRDLAAQDTSFPMHLSKKKKPRELTSPPMSYHLVDIETAIKILTYAVTQILFSHYISIIQYHSHTFQFSMSLCYIFPHALL